MKKSNQPRKMVYTLSINDFKDDKEIIETIKNILYFHKSNIFNGDNSNYKVEMDNMVLVIEGCDC